MPTRRALMALSAALTTTASSSGKATSWPDRPLRWIVGFPAGGAPDLLTRILAQRLEPELGQPVVVENRPGAAGNLAAAALARGATSRSSANSRASPQR